MPTDTAAVHPAATTRSLPFKYRRKNLTDILGPPPSSDVPYAYSDDASASSSPVASSAVLESSVPNSPTDDAHVRDHSSPRRDYYYAYPEDHDLFAWSSSKLPLPDSRSPPSDAYSYRYSASPLSPVLSSFHLPTSYSHSSLRHRLSADHDEPSDPDESEDEPDPFFASPSHRRRISFSTSCERDRPIDRPPPPVHTQPRSSQACRTSETPFPAHVNPSRSTRPVTPERHTHSVSLPRHSPPPRGESSHHDQQAPTPRIAYRSLSPNQVEPSSPLTLSTEVLPAYDDDEEESPLPPSSPPLPSPAHITDDDIRVAQSISPTPPAVRSTSLLAILNPAPDYTPCSLGLVVRASHSRDAQTPTPSPRVSVRLDRPSTPDRNAHLDADADADVQASSSPLSVLSTPIVGRTGEVGVGVSTPVFTPAVLDVPVVIVQEAQDEEMAMTGGEVEVEVDTTVLSSPLSVVSALQDEDADEEEDRVNERKPAKKAGKERADVESEDEVETRTQKKPRKKTSKKAGGTTVQARKAKPKFKRSPRVVYSDLESGGDDDDEETRAADPEVLPTLQAEPEPTHDEEEKKKEKTRKPRGRKRKANLDDDNADSVLQKPGKKARSVAPSEPSITSTTRKRTRPLPTTTQPSPPSSPSKHLTPAQLGEKRAAIERRCPPGVDVSEMEGMIVEALGSARASSLAVESVWRAVKSARPGLEGMRARRAPELQSEEKTQNQKGVEEQIVVGEEKGEANTQEQEEEGEVLEKREWLGIVQDVLEYGRVTSGVFGRVESSFKDEHAHALPPHYFYVPENDGDADRAAIIRSIMPRPAKRSETKKYKQYYWKPLGKVSRWDSEDAM